MGILSVNQEKCIRCGICVEICPLKIIGMGSQGLQTETEQEEYCVACGHCVAVCPRAALDHTKAPLHNQVPLKQFPVLDAETAAQFLRSRRSTRRYRPDKVPRETMLQLLEIARFAPTGVNSQGLSYLVIEDELILKQIIALTIEWMEELAKSDPAGQMFAPVVNHYRQTGEDVILRGAPGLIVALAPPDFGFGHDNACYCLEYVELFATALGLGTCWAGYVQMLARNNYAPLLTAMQIPPEKAVVGVLMAGYPKYTYPRLVDRNPLEVTFVG